MNRKLGVLSIIVLVLLGLVLAQGALGKGHVPAGKVQVCHKNEKVLEIDESSKEDHLGHGDFQLPACDFNNVFHKGEDCSDVSDVDGDGFPDVGLNPRNDAGGQTPACAPGQF